jgi:succinate dehydrogenase / fumarate reductase, iron-sulfur subunit
MNFKLKVWRQKDGASAGSFKEYDAKEIPSEASFLELLNETPLEGGEDPIAFDSDCGEGICETCSLVINDIPHGSGKGSTCQLYMRRFVDGDTIWIEPFHATAFPPIKDLVVDRSSFDRIIEAGGYIVVRTGSAPEANALPVGKHVADHYALESGLCDRDRERGLAV